MHGKTYASLNWRDRATEVKLRAEGVSDALAGADAALSPYGIHLINERGPHVYEEWPGLDRRKVSGSVWDGRQADLEKAYGQDDLANTHGSPAFRQSQERPEDQMRTSRLEKCKTASGGIARASLILSSGDRPGMGR